MKKTSYKPYSGNDKYIFASYSHLDSAIVIPIIKRIQSKGYRIWYDEKIDPGHFWLGKIANQIYACEVFLIFISPNTVKSSYCKDELAYARSKEKPIFCIMLQKTLLEPESEFLLTKNTTILMNTNSTESFFQALCCYHAKISIGHLGQKALGLTNILQIVTKLTLQLMQMRLILRIILLLAIFIRQDKQMSNSITNQQFFVHYSLLHYASVYVYFCGLTQ